MPQPNESEQNKNNEGAGNGSGDGQGQGQSNEGTGNGAGSGQGQGQGAAADETITVKKSEYDQIVADRDNYKEGLLRKKADERELKNNGQGKPNEGDGQGQGAGDAINETKVSEIASRATNKTLREASEKTAKRIFLKKYPEYVDDAQWTALMSNLTFRGGESTPEEVLDRMDAALLEHKRQTGKLDEHLSRERERGRQEGRVEGQLNSAGGSGSAGDRNEGHGQAALSPKGQEMARAMHNDPAKVAKVDPTRDNVINEI